MDLVCINQWDLDERGQQVALMGEIFASAKSVCVWLGELEESDVSTRTDLNVYRCIAQSYGRNSAVAAGALNGIDVRDPQQTHALLYKDGICSWLNDRIFLRQWFQRVWVLQEVWNAPKTFSDPHNRACDRVSVLCGETEIPWWVIMQANMCLYSGYRQHTNHTMPALWLELLDVTSSELPPWLFGTRGRRLDILTVLIGALDMKASDPRDKIFALLVFGEETHKVANLPKLVKPDYNKGVSQVYADFTLWWIAEHRSLKILSAVHTLHGRTWLDLGGNSSSYTNDSGAASQRPSWTPWFNGRSRWRHGSLALREPCPYRACGANVLDIDLLMLGRELRLDDTPKWQVPAFRGIRVSTISTIQSFPLFSQVPQMMEEAYTNIFDPSGILGTWRHSKRNVSELGKNRYLKSEHPSGNLEYHWYTHKRDDTCNITDTALPCHSKCMFDTVDGHIGLCPSGTRTGDLVVILYGGTVPFLLRQKEQIGEYCFVGECYLEGFMNGEAFDSRSRQYAEEVFLLV
ncbi:hypothetical protein H2198_003443 [Neophaeococcomyces mojaviensis]|uniref:Uncharacterized protein n=1 Tax=Neophaeococcomyces mojaviensis TaxID=3383035 RepID=A0ACC3ABA4_9EURO|nr:hypothetical protein H2198_003443 [Knufia sp. JES_112]